MEKDRKKKMKCKKIYELTLKKLIYIHKFPNNFNNLLCNMLIVILSIFIEYQMPL